MGIKKYKPVTPGHRYKTTLTFEEITKTNPEKSLTKGISKTGGRGAKGRITIWHRGGGHKRRYRIIDFKRNKTDVEGTVSSIEYDPNRSCFISLIKYKDGEKRYILTPQGIKIGDKIVSGDNPKIKIGNALPLKNVPLGTEVHNIELTIGKGGQIVRSAGTFATVTAKEGNYVFVKLPSSEVRKIHKNCIATIGKLGNEDNEKVVIGKAGRKRYLGRRPIVRGSAMNPVDHPHGGGEGKTKGGRHPVTPWGVPTKGHKTAKKNKHSKKYVVAERKRGKSKK